MTCFLFINNYVSTNETKVLQVVSKLLIFAKEN